MDLVNPSENWDDDFEFHAKTTATTATSIGITMTAVTTSHAHDRDAHPGRMSFASSDWDNDDNDNQMQDKTKEKTILEDKKNTLHISPEWIEAAGPSTPKRNHHHHHQQQQQQQQQQHAFGHAPSTENWDDDFEDSPLRNGLPSPPGKDKPSPSRTKLRKQQPQQPRPESWDDEFDGLTPAYHSPARQPKIAIRTGVKTGDYSSSEDEEVPGEHNAEFGFPLRDDEDRTVTARSRRAALSRLSPSTTTTSPLVDTEGTPPPPVPPIPLPFLLPEGKHSNMAAYTSSSTNLRSSSPSPFPRSPTSSVFSVPTTIRPPSSAYTVSSTTHLRPTVSRSSSGLGGLPPSPPIHRERRRLRKKSRPPGVGGGAIELSVMTSHREGVGEGREWADGYGYAGHEAGADYGASPLDSDAAVIEVSRPKTPPPPALSSVAQMHSTPSSPSGAGALLSRIGSVRKWGVRRKRGSTTPSEVVNLERMDADSRNASYRAGDDIPNNTNTNTPRPARPHSQASTSSVPSSSESSNAHYHHHQYRSRHHGAFTPPSTAAAAAVPQSQPSTSANSNGTGTGTGTNTTKRISTSNSWFFRSVSSSTNNSNSTGNSNRKVSKGSGGVGRNGINNSTSDLDLTLSDRSSSRGVPPPMPIPQTPVKNKGKQEEQVTPAKLVKRKSLGFVQLRRGLGVGGHGDDDRGREKEKEKEKEKYGGLGLGRAAGGKEKVVDVFGGGGVRELETERERETRGGSGVREHESSKDNEETEKEKDGSRGFMGSVRRISLVGAGRHKRTKSGVSLSNVSPVVARLDVGVELRDETVTPTPRTVGSVTAPVTPMKTPTKSSSSASQDRPLNSLLPPIELQPPSPPRAGNTNTALRRASGRGGVADLLSPASSSSTVATSASAPSPTTSPSSAASGSGVRRSPLGGSPQAASLGRSTVVISESASGGALRRSSLGDLKIPERISQAQVSLRKDMERVREFAAGVEQLKELQTIYNGLVTEIQTVLDTHVHVHAQQQQQQQQPSRTTSPGFFANLARPMSRNRSNTNPPAPSASTASLAQTLAVSTSPPPLFASPIDVHSVPQLAYKQLASAYYTIRSRYRISWECAELLIDLGSGNTERGPPSTSTSAPVVPTVSFPADVALGRRKSPGRERAITLGGEDSKPPTPIPGQLPPSSASTPGMGAKSGWRASTGKHDLSQRQLVLLKEMLGSGDAGVNGSLRVDEGSIPEEAASVNREWRWGKDPMGSTLTLPSEDSSAPEAPDGKEGKLRKKRRASRLAMTGLRDMLRLLKRSQVDGLTNTQDARTPPNAAPMSSTSLATTDNSSMDSHRYPHAHVPPTQGRKRAKTSTGPDSVRLGRTTSPHGPSSSLTSGKPSPRRPSLASIFRLGQKPKPTSPDLPPELREHNHYHRQDQSPSRKRHGPPRSRSASGRESSSTGEEEDWDRMEDASDIDAIGRALGVNEGSATVRGKARRLHRSPYLQDAYTPSLPSLPSHPLTPKRSASESQTSLGDAKAGSGNMTPPHPPLPHPMRVTRLSNVEEHENTESNQGNVSLPRSSSRGSNYRHKTSSPRGAASKTGSVRSMPPQPVANSLPDPTLAMTPDNIKPLLENAREVHARLVECNTELRALLAGYVYR